jgi:hypothetical protein
MLVFVSALLLRSGRNPPFFRSDEFDSFDQPIPVLLKVPVSDADFFARVMAVIGVFLLCDLLCLGAYIYRRVRIARRTIGQGKVSRTDFDLDSTYANLRSTEVPHTGN